MTFALDIHGRFISGNLAQSTPVRNWDKWLVWTCIKDEPACIDNESIHIFTDSSEKGAHKLRHLTDKTK